jgi:hypothetical protein
MKPQQKQFDISAVFTRPRANSGVPVEVKAPDGRTVLGTITVRGADSDAFQAALWEKSRENARILSLPAAEQPAARREAELKLIASLIVGWSFSTPFTEENVLELLRNAPAVYNLVDETAGKRELYWDKPTG